MIESCERFDNSLKDRVKAFVHEECEESWKAWKRSVLAVTSEKQSPGLRYRLEKFADTHKASFFKNFPEKVSHKMESAFSDALSGVKKEIDILHGGTIGLMKAQMDRFKVEVYLKHKKNIAAASRELDMNRTTLHEWLKINEELVISEERQAAKVMATFESNDKAGE